MKMFGVLGITICLAFAGVILSTPVLTDAVYNGKDRIEISGKGNTLASIAADIANPEVFSYDAKTRIASCHCGLFVGPGAELTLGKKDDANAGEVLQIVCAPELERSALGPIFSLSANVRRKSLQIPISAKLTLSRSRNSHGQQRILHP